MSKVRSVALLVGVWVALLGLLGLFQMLGMEFGLQVWPIGEDNNFLYMLQNAKGRVSAQMFWDLDRRNPLGMWWYVAAKSLINGSDPSAWHLLRRATDLLCAVSVLLLLEQLGRGRQTTFAFSCAALVMLWNFAYPSLLIWVVLLAASQSVLAIWLYCKYLDEGGRSGWCLALSLVLYFFAVTTYTLQSSLFLAVFALALFRPLQRPGSPREWLLRVVMAGRDAGFYLLLFAAYHLIWMAVTIAPLDQTTLSPGSALHLFPKAVLQAIWHPLNTYYLVSALSRWTATEFTLTATLALVGFLGLFGLVRRWCRPVPDNRMVGVAGWTWVVAGSLVATTLVVETMTVVYRPGDRTIMAQQLVQPMLYVSALFVLAGILGGVSRRLGEFLRFGGVGLLCSLAFVLMLNSNRVSVQQTKAQKHFIACLKTQVPTVDRPTTVIILDPINEMRRGLLFCPKPLRQFYKSHHVDLQFLQVGQYNGIANPGRVVFGPQIEGITVSPWFGTTAKVPYERVLFARYQNGQFEFLAHITREDLKDFQANVLFGAEVAEFAPPFL